MTEPTYDPITGAELPPPNVHQLISKVKDSIGSVGKEKRMKEGPAKYAYRSIDDILDAAHAGLIEHGVFWVPSVESMEWSEFETKSGAKGLRVVAVIGFEIFGPAGDSFKAKVIGEAQDYSDKAANKAHTAAQKILLGQLFAIPFAAEDPDDSRIERGTPEVDPLDVPTKEWRTWAKAQILEVVGYDREQAAARWAEMFPDNEAEISERRARAAVVQVGEWEVSKGPPARREPAPPTGPSATPADEPDPITPEQWNAYVAKAKEITEEQLATLANWADGNGHKDRGKTMPVATWTALMKEMDNFTKGSGKAGRQPPPSPALSPASRTLREALLKRIGALPHDLQSDLMGVLEKETKGFGPFEELVLEVMPPNDAWDKYLTDTVATYQQVAAGGPGDPGY